MKVTFCGHSVLPKDFDKELMMRKVFNLLDTLSIKGGIECYLGGYGEFDEFMLKCCNNYASTHMNIKTIFVTPYIDEVYLARIKNFNYDEIVYPDIENIPKRYAITYRNRYMMDIADIVVSYVRYDWGGANKTLKYAKEHNKQIINLYDYV